MIGKNLHRLSAIPVHRGREYDDDMRRLYRSAFPCYERVPYEALLYSSETGISDHLAFLDGDLFVGMAHVIKDKEAPCLLYFAVDPSFRGEGYGSSALYLLDTLYPDKKIFLHVEDPEEKNTDKKLRQKRMQFYLKNGLHLTKHKIPWEALYRVLTFRGNVSVDGTWKVYGRFERAYTKKLGVSPKYRESD